MRTRSRIAVLVAAAPVVLALAGPASADTGQWTAWKNVPVAKPYHFLGCGGAHLESRDYIQHEKTRTRSLGHGNTAIETYGRYEVKLIDHDHGTSAIVNVSGSSLGRNFSIAYENGDYLYRATGANLLLQARTHPVSPGLFRNFVSQGRISLMFFHDQSKTPKLLDRPDTVTNACSLLK